MTTEVIVSYKLEESLILEFKLKMIVHFFLSFQGSGGELEKPHFFFPVMGVSARGRLIWMDQSENGTSIAQLCWRDE